MSGLPDVDIQQQLLFLGVGQTHDSLKHRRTPWVWPHCILMDGLALHNLHFVVRLLLLDVLVSHYMVGVEDPAPMVHHVQRPRYGKRPEMVSHFAISETHFLQMNGQTSNSEYSKDL